MRTAALTVTVPHPLSAELSGASPMPMKSAWLMVEDENCLPSLWRYLRDDCTHSRLFDPRPAL